jgi:hypothetical protein
VTNFGRLPTWFVLALIISKIWQKSEKANSILVATEQAGVQPPMVSK